MLLLITCVYHIIFIITLLCALAYGFIWIHSRIFGRHLNKCGSCVLITGCDTGFGYLTALEFNKHNVFTFAGCLTEQGLAILLRSSAAPV